MDIEKTMEFILSTQARLEASAAAHDERFAKLEFSAQGHEDRLKKLEASVGTVTNLAGCLAQAEIRLVERMDSMAERMTAGFHELRELHPDTESKLKPLIDTVDKLARRNGHQ